MIAAGTGETFYFTKQKREGIDTQTVISQGDEAKLKVLLVLVFRLNVLYTRLWRHQGRDVTSSVFPYTQLAACNKP